MFQIPLVKPSSFSVTEVTTYLRTLLESDPLLQDVWISGEVSNLSRPASGHIYFTLKDASAAIKCVIWRSTAMRISRDLQVGSQIEAHGAVTVYERDGAYQLYVNAVRMRGEGELFQEFLRQKARLEAEGYFDEDRKRALPTLPLKIGIVTSATGAALQDMLNTLRGRYPLAEVFLSPAAVQGLDAPREIVNALRRLNREITPDVILLGRGGGSMEDLWAFNDVGVVEAIIESKAPVVTGIGHETDFTLADFVSDARAPTPTGAAVMATPSMEELFDGVNIAAEQLTRLVLSTLDMLQNETFQMRERLNRESPLRRVDNDRQAVDAFSSKIISSTLHRLTLKRVQINHTVSQLQTINPQAILRRGYSLVRLEDGTLVKDANQLVPGSRILTRFSRGSAVSRVESTSLD